MRVGIVVLLTVGALCVSGAGVIVVDKDEQAVVVTPDEPGPVTAAAAEELVEHIRLATGKTLVVVKESEIPEGVKTRVYLGPTKAVAELGVDVKTLAPEAFVWRTHGNNLYIAGNEDMRSAYEHSNSLCGTLFGVYEFLERCLEVRWLWPGELGRHVPKRSRVVVNYPDEECVPQLNFRIINWSRVRSAAFDKNAKIGQGERQLGFSEGGLKEYGYALRSYLRRHRMGGWDRKPGVGHHFGGWWGKYGKEHPGWFMLNAEGKRGRSDGGAAVPMCVSNPELQRFIIENWNGKKNLNMGEVDWPDCCRCPSCRAWDGPALEPLPEYLVSSTEGNLPRSKEWQKIRSHVHSGFYTTPMCTSDRYARFWKTLAEMAVKRNPEALITTYLYYSYFPAPVTGIKLNRHIYGEFVPWGNPQHTDFFPMEEEAYKWVKEQWDGWRKTGIRMAYRPNYLHDGWVMPLVETRQCGEFIRYAAANGMEGAYFDSLTGQWATQGPKLYLHMRLLAKPELSVESVLEEYYSGFGLASSSVREYFEYWESYCRENYKMFNRLYIDHGHRWARFQVRAHEAFPESAFVPAFALLEGAERAAVGSAPEFGARVRFLRDGLEHARLAGRLAACFDGDKSISPEDPRFAQAVELLRDLIAFRRAHEVPFISDYFYGASWREYNFWNLKPMLEVIEKGVADKGGEGDTRLVP